MQNNNMAKILIMAGIAALVAVILVISYKLNAPSKPSSSDNKGVYIAYKKGSTYKYLPNEMEVNFIEEDGYTYIPTMYREKKTSLVYKEIENFDPDQFRMTPASKSAEAKPDTTTLKAYKVTYITNIEPSTYVQLHCNDVAASVMPIVTKGVEMFQYETIICLDAGCGKCKLSIIEDGEVSDSIAIK